MPSLPIRVQRACPGFGQTRHEFGQQPADVYDAPAWVRYQLSPATGLGLKWRYGSNVPVAGYLARAGETWFVASLRNRSRLPTYARLDLRADHGFNFGKARRLTLFAEVVNVLDRDNFGPADPAIRLRRFEAVRVTETLLPRVPAVGITVAF